MRIFEIDSGRFDKVLVHETTPENAEKIKARGFQMDTTGIFFNAEGLSYSGGEYGGAEIRARIVGPMAGILDLEDEENLPPDLDIFADGEDIARYARRKGFWAWTDGMQLSVLRLFNIQVLK
jgi:hypothetical protein